MASNLQSLGRLVLIGLLAVFSIVRLSRAQYGYGSPVSYAQQPSEWNYAHATFYGDDSGAATMGGACGYGNLFNNGYGTDTAALSTTLFNNGYACGSCYEIKCVDSKWCNSNGGGGYGHGSGETSIIVTATNLCPPNWYQASDNGGWCNPPRVHFDLAKPAFNKLAYYVAGIVPVQYRRVPCKRTGGIRFSFEGNNYWLLVYVMNVGGSGDITQMWVKGTETDWICMSHNWGITYQAFSQLGGQSLSFKVQSSNQQTLICYNVVPAYWSIGMTYECDVNFH